MISDLAGIEVSDATDEANNWYVAFYRHDQLVALLKTPVAAVERAKEIRALSVLELGPGETWVDLKRPPQIFTGFDK